MAISMLSIALQNIFIVTLLATESTQLLGDFTYSTSQPRIGENRVAFNYIFHIQFDSEATDETDPSFGRSSTAFSNTSVGGHCSFHYTPWNRPALDENIVHDDHPEYPLRILVLTYRRHRSLLRLLSSLAAADYQGDVAALDILVDRY
jgi:hypothetical protein